MIILNRFNKYLVFLLPIVMLTGCVDSYKLRQVDRAGNFVTADRVPTKEINIDHSINLQSYRRLLVVGIRSDDGVNQITTDKFWISAIERMNFFNHVISTDNMPLFMIKNGYGSNAPSSMASLIDLHKFEKSYGDFLVADISLVSMGGYENKLIFRVIDPKSAKIYFEVERSAFNWIGLDGNLLYPVLNAFHDWLVTNNAH